ncbi:MAG: hypothetical protein EA428_01315, partial [Spirochaetaceae bacterium]
ALPELPKLVTRVRLPSPARSGFLGAIKKQHKPTTATTSLYSTEIILFISLGVLLDNGFVIRHIYTFIAHRLL